MARQARDERPPRQPDSAPPATSPGADRSATIRDDPDRPAGGSRSTPSPVVIRRPGPDGPHATGRRPRPRRILLLPEVMTRWTSATPPTAPTAQRPTPLAQARGPPPPPSAKTPGPHRPDAPELRERGDVSSPFGLARGPATSRKEDLRGRRHPESRRLSACRRHVLACRGQRYPAFEALATHTALISRAPPPPHTPPFSRHPTPTTPPRTRPTTNILEYHPELATRLRRPWPSGSRGGPTRWPRADPHRPVFSPLRPSPAASPPPLDVGPGRPPRLDPSRPPPPPPRYWRPGTPTRIERPTLTTKTDDVGTDLLPCNPYQPT